MANIKVSELNEASSINDNDLLMIVQNNETKKIAKENIIPFGKLLWTGNFSANSITISNLSKYTILIMIDSDGVVYIGSKNNGIGGYTIYAGYTSQIRTYRFGVNGNSLIIDANNTGASNGTQTVSVVAIYGLF